MDCEQSAYNKGGESVDEIRKLRGNEKEFFLNKKGNIQYNDTCLSCKKNCKQSFRVHVICPIREKAHKPDDYYKKITKTDGRLDTIGSEIGENNRKVKHMILEKCDMSYEVYDKLEDLLFPSKNKKGNKKG